MLSQKDKEIEVLKEHQHSSTNAMEESQKLEDKIASLKSIIDDISQEKVYLLKTITYCSTLVD